VPDEVSAVIGALDDPVVAIIALDLRENGFVIDLDTSKWNSSMTGEDLYTGSWSLAYEARVRVWLLSKNGDDYISADPFFSDIHAFNVHFYDTAEGQPAIPSIWEGY